MNLVELLNNKISSTKAEKYIHISSCLQCKPCGSGCTIVDNRVSFVFDADKKYVSHILFDPTPIACMGRCGKSCQAALHLVHELKLRAIPIE